MKLHQKIFKYSGYILLLYSCKTSDVNLPVADFDFTKSDCDSGCKILFQNKSQHATDFQWDFGDSTRSTEENPEKKYQYPGLHTVVLTVKNRKSSAEKTSIVSTDPPKPVLAILPAINSIGLPDSIRDKLDATKTSNITHPLYLPANCENGFAVCNTGEKGSKLHYIITDMDGYYSFNDPTGTLNAGEGIYIQVKAKSLNWFGTSSLKITSDAANGNSHFVSFPRYPMLEEAKKAIGTWRGTWNGKSYGAANPSEPLPYVAVNGTWSLEIKSVDTTDSSATGTFIWNGNDAYWTYNIDGGGKITQATPVAFPTNYSISLDKKNFKFILPGSGGSCHQYRILINDQIPGSSFGNYGPKFRMDVNLVSNADATGGLADFVAWPHAPSNAGNLSTNQSNGTVSGKKD